MQVRAATTLSRRRYHAKPKTARWGMVGRKKVARPAIIRAIFESPPIHQRYPKRGYRFNVKSRHR